MTAAGCCLQDVAEGEKDAPDLLLLRHFAANPNFQIRG
jgi:hypothetical protein